MTKEWDHMQHVFISYKNEDLDFADNVISRLEREGFTTWSDLKIGAGEEWRNSIDLAIKNAFALIVIMTPEAKASEYVTYEWAFAWGVGIWSFAVQPSAAAQAACTWRISGRVGVQG
jgi:hypothetical protein